MFHVIIDNEPIVQEDEKCGIFCPDSNSLKVNHTILNAYLQKQNFRQMSVMKWKKCNRPNCGLFIHLLQGISIHSIVATIAKLHEKMPCDVKNIIYVMKCRGCGEKYIGETGIFLSKRVTIYNQQIRDPRTRMLKVSEHKDTCTYTLNSKYFIFPFYKMYTDSPTLRRANDFNFSTLRSKLNRAV